MCRKYEQSVEPAPSLIHSFRYKVSWERSFLRSLVFEWVVILSVGHAVRRVAHISQC